MQSESPSPELCSPAKFESKSPDWLIWKRRWYRQTTEILRITNEMLGGWCGNQEGSTLLNGAAILPPGSLVVEIGSFMGKSSRYLISGCMYSDSKLVCIDPFTAMGEGEGELWVADPKWAIGAAHKESIAKYYKRVAPAGTLSMFYSALDSILGIEFQDFVTVKEMISEEAAINWDLGKIDFIFLDGNHRSCQQDVNVWMPHLAEHAAIAFHDFSPEGGLYGPDGPNNTWFRLIQQGWKQIEQAELTSVVTRDPEWWRTRLEATRDCPEVCQDGEGQSTPDGRRESSPVLRAEQPELRPRPDSETDSPAGHGEDLASNQQSDRDDDLSSRSDAGEDYNPGGAEKVSRD